MPCGQGRIDLPIRQANLADREVTVEAIVTAVDDRRCLLRADGYLSVDSRVNYGMKEFTLRQRKGWENQCDVSAY